MVKKVLVPLETKWNKAYRMKGRFLNENYKWLDCDFIVNAYRMKGRFLNENYKWLDCDFIVNIKALDGSSTSGLPGGRRSKSNDDASVRIKRTFNNVVANGRVTANLPCILAEITSRKQEQGSQYD
ncbi:hypothetical protein QE152_g38250 [Popillia japonica]|uniref:Transposase n=1 Tax=Popillia japonica TaxID=7064 RepID=A0AAW1I6P1_POPJA